MGVDARWVCHTCKTVCSRGGHPLVRSDVEITTVEIDAIKEMLADLKAYVELDDFEQSLVPFLDDLDKWLSRHETHSIHIGSDYSTDMVDLDDYHNESVDGKVSICTRDEVRCKRADEWEQTAVKQIGQIIGEHGLEIEAGNTEPVARELYNRFSMREI